MARALVGLGQALVIALLVAGEVLRRGNPDGARAGGSCSSTEPAASSPFGLASLTNSRPATITVLVGVELVASPLLLQDSTLGSVRKRCSTVRSSISPRPSPAAPPPPESLFAALFVMALWLVVAAGPGAWRTSTMDA